MEISIKKPCHENWDAMTPNDQGAFCNKCVKTVIDFSNKSIEEIKDFFSSKQKEKICGRFEKDQLISLSFDAFFSEFRGFNFTRRFAVILYFTFGMWLFNASSSMAQTQESIKGDVKVDHAIMGGVRAMPEKKDTTKTSTRSTGRPIKDKVRRKEPQVQTARNKEMGEVDVAPVKKVVTKSENPKTKK